MWVDETGLVESALSVDQHAGASEHTARRQRFANQLHRFVAEEPEATLQQPTVIVHLEFDFHSWSGPGFGPLGARDHLHRALGELIELALVDLSPRA